MSEWFYQSEGQHLGPVNESTLRKLYANGKLPGDALVWQDGFADGWRPLASTVIAVAVADVQMREQQLPARSMTNLVLALSPLLFLALDWVASRTASMSPGSYRAISSSLTLALTILALRKTKEFQRSWFRFIKIL